MAGIKANINSDNGNSLIINEEGGIITTIQTYPPLNEVNEALPFRSYFTFNGSSSLRVNGSTTPVEFSIQASQTRDIFIKTISVEIIGASAKLSDFGSIAAIANGVEFFWFTQEEGEILIHEGVKSNWEFIRLCGGKPAFGDGANSFRGSNVQSTTEGFIPIMDVSEIFGLPWGFRLKKGTTDKLVFRVNDNLTSVTAIDIIGYGIQI